MGLQLKPTKTTIAHTLREHDGNPAGFDFLGFGVRQFPVGKNRSGKLGRCGARSVPLGFKTIIRPSKGSLLRHLSAVKEIVRTHKAAPQAALIRRLNPLIKGWASYYSSSSAAKVFHKADHLVYLKLEAWATRRHPNKPRRWISRKYWHTRGDRRWEFYCEKSAVGLQRHGEVHIRRHVKVRDKRSPYDGDWSYWATRMGTHPELPKRAAKLLRRQKGRCAWCGLYFKDADLLEIDHWTPTALGGLDLPSNRQLLHGHCHDEKTASDSTAAATAGTRDKGRAIEEPDDGKPSRPVLETSRRG
jgi:RNA-directed DNA polymerase